MKRCNPASERRPLGRRRAPAITRALVAALCLSVFIGGPARAADNPGTAEEVGLGIASVILTIPYGVSKLLYAGLGSVVGGFSWILSGGNTDTAESIWNPSLHGTYVITPDHLRGRKPIRFIGRVSSRDDDYMP